MSDASRLDCINRLNIFCRKSNRPSVLEKVEIKKTVLIFNYHSVNILSKQIVWNYAFYRNVFRHVCSGILFFSHMCFGYLNSLGKVFA